MTPTNAITWFELPTQDLKRAVTFYETVLGDPAYKVRRDRRDVPLPSDPRGLKGALIRRNLMKPVWVERSST